MAKNKKKKKSKKKKSILDEAEDAFVDQDLMNKHFVIIKTKKKGWFSKDIYEVESRPYRYHELIKRLTIESKQRLRKIGVNEKTVIQNYDDILKYVKRIS